MIFKLVLESFFWGFVIQIFFFIVEIFSGVSFGITIYTLQGFFLMWIYAFIIILSLRIANPPKK